MSTQENVAKRVNERSDVDLTVSAYSQNQSESTSPKYVDKELRQQFQFPEAVWKKLAKR